MSEEIQSSAKDEALEDSNVGSPDLARVDERSSSAVPTEGPIEEEASLDQSAAAAE